MVRVLLCEDDASVSQIVMFALKKKGHEVTPVRDGQTAVDEAIRIIPDIVLMDMTLPVKHGDVAAREIRANERTKNIPIIPLTAVSTEKLEVLRAEFGRVISKPFRIAEVIAIVEEATSATRS